MYDRSRGQIRPTGREREWGTNEIIVTKTDLKGRITYANEVFLRVAALTEASTLGQPHNIIRHPEMPRAVFKLLWDTLQARKEIFAYVNNMAMTGDHYWVFAHVTPSFGPDGKVVGYHSNRRKPKAEQIARITPIYRSLLEEERRYGSPKDAIAASNAALHSLLASHKVTYDEFVFSL